MSIVVVNDREPPAKDVSFERALQRLDENLFLRWSYGSRPHWNIMRHCGRRHPAFVCSITTPEGDYKQPGLRDLISLAASDMWTSTQAMRAALEWEKRLLEDSEKTLTERAGIDVDMMIDDALSTEGKLYFT